MTARREEPVGTFCLVLHSHLPWLAHHGAWPVGEEWLYQSWAHVVPARASTCSTGWPPRAAATCSPSASRRCSRRSSTTRTASRELHTWLGVWQAAAPRASRTATRTRRATPGRASSARRTRALADVRGPLGAVASRRSCARWSTPTPSSCSAARPRTRSSRCSTTAARAFALRTGLDDATAAARVAVPAGSGRPSAATAPGSSTIYAAAGVEPLPRRRAHRARRGDTRPPAPDRRATRRRRVRPRPRRHLPRVVAAKRLPRRPLVPRLPHLRPRLGLQARPASRADRTPSAREGALRPGPRPAAVERDVDDFVEVVRQRLADIAPRATGGPDSWSRRSTPSCSATGGTRARSGSSACCARCPRPGVRVTTLRGAVEAGYVERPRRPRRRVVGLGQGLAGVGRRGRCADLVDDNDACAEPACSRSLDAEPRPWARDAARDQLAREALLALSSDWAFMVSKDSAAGYARDRHRRHHLRDARARGPSVERGVAGRRAARGRAARRRRAVRPPRCAPAAVPAPRRVVV